jgi:hypothetical protein
MFRLARDVGEITSTAPGNKDLFAGTLGVLNHGDAAATLASLHRAHKSRSPGAKN